METDCKIGALTPEQTAIPSLGRPKVDNPFDQGCFVDDNEAIVVHHSRKDLDRQTCDENGQLVYFEVAGPREKLYFDPTKAKCAIVTCGGLCPGINNVIRSIVLEAWHHYNVPAVLGIQYGLEGFIPAYNHNVLELTPKAVSDIHEFGGTILGTSRGPQEMEDIVDALDRLNISVLFIIGGDGTMRAASKIYEEVTRRKLKISVIGVPKTIDNDINFVARSFGFDTAVEKATEAIRCAHTEALGAPNGIGLVKLMGRNAGYIAAQSALALRDVNFVLVPEEKFDMHGEKGFLVSLERRLADRGHAVVVAAEGAGQELLSLEGGTDASGNVKLGDISSYLKKEITEHFSKCKVDITLKVIDPSYIIRAVPANSNDGIYCGFLGQHSLHAAMAGRTGMVVSKWNGRYVHIPLSMVTCGKKNIDVNSNYWRSVIESTGQPCPMRND